LVEENKVGGPKQVERNKKEKWIQNSRTEAGNVPN
jgi:hypothetical protein